jgi:heme a synthase
VLANPARVAIHFTHRLGALVTGCVLITLGASTLVLAKSRRLARAGLLVVLAVAAQIFIGMATVHWGVPLPLATMHNAGAAFLVISMVTLLRALWPTPAIGMVPLQHADPSR